MIIINTINTSISAYPFTRKKSLHSVGAKGVFLQLQLLGNIDLIIQFLIFFSDNATIIYWMKETNSCFLRIATKAPVRIQQQNLYSAFEWI